MRTLFLLTTLLFIIPNMFGQKEYRLNSPDGKLEVTLYIGDRITYELTEEGHTLVAPSPLSVHLDNRTCLLYTSPSPRDGATSRMPSSA